MITPIKFYLWQHQEVSTHTGIVKSLSFDCVVCVGNELAEVIRICTLLQNTIMHELLEVKDEHPNRRTV